MDQLTFPYRVTVYRQSSATSIAKKVGHSGWKARLPRWQKQRQWEAKGKAEVGSFYSGSEGGYPKWMIWGLWEHGDRKKQQGRLLRGGDAESDPKEKQRTARKDRQK